MTLRVINFSHDKESNAIFDELNKLIHRLYHNEGTQREIQELGSKYTNEQQLRELFPFNWEALAKDAVVQNLIPDDIYFFIKFENSRES